MGNQQVLTGYHVKYQVVYSDGSLGDFYQRRDSWSKDKRTAIIALRKYLENSILTWGEPKGTTVQLIDCDRYSYWAPVCTGTAEDACDIMDEHIST